MSDGKRKQGPGGRDGSAPKRSKGGSGGKWRTPHQQAKLGERTAMGKTIEVGDQGVWVTFARGMKGKAIRELNQLCEEYGEKLYGIKKEKEAEDEDDEDDGGDIEASIAKEMDAMAAKKTSKTPKIFTMIPADVECLLFIKTTAPVDPLEFVRAVCNDARSCRDILRRKTRYINRLTPVVAMDKASENGITKVARQVMGPHFNLVAAEEEETDSKAEEKEAITYAIRPTTRNHTAFKSDAIIKKVAGLVRPEHKVNLGKPDKVIVVEVYQMLCGVSVVDGAEWERLKRYNVNELYRIASEEANQEGKEESTTEAKDESKDDKPSTETKEGESKGESVTAE